MQKDDGSLCKRNNRAWKHGIGGWTTFRIGPGGHGWRCCQCRGPGCRIPCGRSGVPCRRRQEGKCSDGEDGRTDSSSMSRHGAYHGRLLVSLQHSTSTTPRLTTTFSQGGQLVHNAADMLSAQDSAFVQASVIFGDPNNGSPVGKVSAAQTKVICHTGDLICAHQAVILAPHLTVRPNRPEIMLYNANFSSAVWS
jgi:hypothetical protein